MAEKTFRVTGVQAFNDNAPGSTFKADPDDPVVQRAVEAGVLSEGASTKPIEEKSRDELNEFAEAADVDRPHELDDKKAVVKAIRDKAKE